MPCSLKLLQQKQSSQAVGTDSYEAIWRLHLASYHLTPLATDPPDLCRPGQAMVHPRSTRALALALLLLLGAFTAGPACALAAAPGPSPSALAPSPASALDRPSGGGAGEQCAANAALLPTAAPIVAASIIELIYLCNYQQELCNPGTANVSSTLSLLPQCAEARV